MNFCLKRSKNICSDIISPQRTRVITVTWYFLITCAVTSSGDDIPSLDHLGLSTWTTPSRAFAPAMSSLTWKSGLVILQFL